MKLKYEDLLSGDSIFIDGVGHIRSPRLSELKPTNGIGTWNYDLYINLLVWDKEELLKFLKVITQKNLFALTKSNMLNVFDIITLLDSSRELVLKMLNFFIEEDVEWADKERKFLTYSKENHEFIGSINRDNFDDIRDMLLQMNYINLEKASGNTKYASDKAKALWEKAQQHLKTDAAKKTSDKRMRLGNIISKLSCVSIGYTLLNIYDLTIFQLYDQFFQYGYIRAMDLSEMAYSNHGGKDFDIQSWLNPITNI